MLSDPWLRSVFIAGLSAIFVSMLLLVYVVFLRLTLIERQQREQRFLDIWRPLMLEATEHAPADLPALAPADHHAFLKLWNHYQELLRGDAREKLVALARRCGMEQVARAMLVRRSFRDRLIAANTLGHMRAADAWTDLVEVSREPHPLTSICAARALLTIDAGRALPVLMPAFLARGEWPVARVTAMLSEAGADTVSGPLVAALEAAAGEDGATFKVERLLCYIEVAHTELASATLLRVLQAGKDDNIVATCLKSLRDPSGLEIVRSHLAHATWFVRTQAVTALGRIGTVQDCERLIALLSDPVWWVRYRAAQAIVALQPMHGAELQRIRMALSDRFAVNIFDQVIAESAAT